MIDFSAKPLFLAPLAGLSDLPFRGVVKAHGCDVTVSEMLSANALVYEGAKTLAMAAKNPAETPYIAQLEGGDPEMIRRAVLVLNEIDGIDGIDLNCGCPVPKVVKQNAGSALLKDPALLCHLVEIIKKTSNKRYTSVKLRLGFDSVTLPSFVRDIESAGADFIAVHARTRSGGFTSEPKYEVLGEIKSNLKIPLVANGSIDETNAAEVLAITGADGLMIGRAAIGKPWIFESIKEALGDGNSNLNVSQAHKKQVIKEHFAAMIAHYGEHGVSIFRKHLHEYSRGLGGASEFRREINELRSSEEMRAAIERFF